MMVSILLGIVCITATCTGLYFLDKRLEGQLVKVVSIGIAIALTCAVLFVGSGIDHGVEQADRFNDTFEETVDQLEARIDLLLEKIDEVIADLGEFRDDFHDNIRELNGYVHDLQEALTQITDARTLIEALAESGG